MTLKDHVIKKFCDFIEGISSLYRSLLAITIVVVEIEHIFICQVTLQDNMIKESSDFMEGNSLLNVTTLLGCQT